MPWTHCDRELRDDETCACGLTKDAWTVHLDATREFLITKKPRKKQERAGWIEVAVTLPGDEPSTSEGVRPA